MYESLSLWMNKSLVRLSSSGPSSHSEATPLTLLEYITTFPTPLVAPKKEDLFLLSVLLGLKWSFSVLKHSLKGLMDQENF